MDFRLFTKSGEPMAVSRDAHRRMIGDLLIVAEPEKPGRAYFLSRHPLGRRARWAFPGDKDGVRAVLLALLDALHNLGAVSGGVYQDLREGRMWREIVELASVLDCWHRILTDGREGLCVAYSPLFDPDQHGIVWMTPGEEAEGDELAAILAEINQCESGERRYYTISAGTVKKMWPGTYQYTDGPWVLASGVEQAVIGRDMIRLTDTDIRKRIAWVKARTQA